MGACPRPRVDGDARRAAGRLVVVEAPRRWLASDGLLHAGAARCARPGLEKRSYRGDSVWA
eukprot:147444-Prymnesium_polylepis.1